jgi:osmotically inducible lipoprotein OsmB
LERIQYDLECLKMKNLLSAFAVVSLLGLCGCSNMTHQQQRALSGGALGAAGGAIIGAVTGGSAVTGALLGGAGGAAVGALTH